MADQISASHILLMHSESERSSATRIKSEALDLINNIKVQVDAGVDLMTWQKNILTAHHLTREAS